MWWKIRKEKVSQIVDRVTSAKLEGNFSDAGHTLAKKRNGLKPSVVNSQHSFLLKIECFQQSIVAF